MTGRSEASLVEVRLRIDEVVAELEGCRLVILCGKRAQSLLGGLEAGMSGVAFACACHPGVRRHDGDLPWRQVPRPHECE